MVKFYDVPFAEQGDKDPVPTGAQPDGSVSFVTGYTPNYDLEIGVDDGAKPVERGEMNTLFHDITEALGFAQKHGASMWSTAGKPYAINDIVRFGDKNWLSLIGVNNDQPAEGLSWTEFSANVLKKITPLLSQPVGVCYTQYPSTPTPAALFGGSWKILFADEGAFFRTEGVGASAFESGLQQDSLKSHGHSASSSAAGGHNHTGTSSTTGGHAHSGTTAAAGNHAHSGSANAAGNHAHSGTANNAGNHTHSGSLGISYGGSWLNSSGFEEGRSAPDWRAGPMGASGSHNHSLSINAAGNHTHTLSTNTTGSHTHTLSTNTTGSHTHTVTTSTIANHTHAITVSNTGESETRPTNRTIRVWQRTA